MNKRLLNQLKDLQLGDLIRVEWTDASIGRSMSAENIDVPVVSYGVYLGLLGEIRKHIVLCQNSFKYTNGIYDVDYTAIPASWPIKIAVIQKTAVDFETAKVLLQSFLSGRCRTIKRRVRNHEEPR